jgi:hypothetical protein
MGVTYITGMKVGYNMASAEILCQMWYKYTSVVKIPTIHVGSGVWERQILLMKIGGVVLVKRTIEVHPALELKVTSC